jgi:S1-C subfamily serine protease
MHKFFSFHRGDTPQPWRWGRRPAALPTLLGALTLGGVLLAGCAGSPSSPATINTSNTPAPVSPSSQTTSLQSNVESVIQKVQPSVVEVTSTNSSNSGGLGLFGNSATASEAIGSGEILTSNGYIVTNDHVVAGFNSFQVTLANGKNFTAQLVGTDPNDDLAVLKINASNLPTITLGDSGKVQVGEFAIAIGTPLGLTQSATFGIVSATNRDATEAPNGPASELTGLIQTSAPINPGNSGGALVDLSGRLIGIPTLTIVDPETGTAANGIGFAIPSNRVQFIAQQLIKNGKVTSTGQGFLGVGTDDVTPILAQQYNLPVQSGAIVVAFSKDTAGVSPAQQAGIKINDIITAVNGTPVDSSNSLAAVLISQSPGTTVTVTVQRGSKQLNIKVKLGERPANAG